MLPNLIVIGAMKCATTSLHYYLSCHPQISMSREKELDFFIERRNWGRGVGWYESHFTTPAPVRGESSPNYTNYPTNQRVAARMHSVVPGARLVYILRDPVERIVSHYVHKYADGGEDRDFAAVLADLEGNAYVQRSLYHMQLEQFLGYYGAQSILILTSEELAARRAPTMSRVFRFLGVDASYTSRRFVSVRHRSAQKRRKSERGERLTAALVGSGPLARLRPDLRWHVERAIYYPFSRPVKRPLLDERTRRRLTDRLLPDVEKLRAFAGRDFAEWNLPRS
ncbi:MAG: sulfotransferase domain-containing protein [Acidobacteria bacterium]|nr:sulfotransferase domain-containing protein [Acidobacteriota bacterium]